MGKGDAGGRATDRAIEYAFIGHESAVTVHRAIARGLVPTLPCPDIMILPEADLCVTNQRKFKALAREVDFGPLGLAGQPVHLVVPYATVRSSGRLAQFHVWGDIVPDDAFIRLHERLFVSSPLFTVLQLVCAHRPTNLTKQQVQEGLAEEASIRRSLGLPVSGLSEKDLLAWEGVRRTVEAARVLTEFAGTYRLPSRDGESVLYDQPVLVACGRAGAYLRTQLSMRGVARAREVVSLAFDGSASPMETMLVLILTLPVGLGGYGLPRPKLNVKIEASGLGLSVCQKEAMVADLYWDEARLVVEYDSDEFHAGRGRGKLADDAERANSLSALGYRVFSVPYMLLENPKRLDLLAQQIAYALGVELARPNELQAIFRARLHALLLPPVNRER